MRTFTRSAQLRASRPRASRPPKPTSRMLCVSPRATRRRCPRAPSSRSRAPIATPRDSSSPTRWRAEPSSVVARLALSHLEQSSAELACRRAGTRRSSSDRARQHDRADAPCRDRARARVTRRQRSRTPTRAQSLAPAAKRSARRARLREPARIRHTRRRACVRRGDPTRARRADGSTRSGAGRDPKRRSSRRAAAARAGCRARSRQRPGPQLHGKDLRRRESRRADGEPTRSGQSLRSPRSDSVVVFFVAQPANESPRRSAARLALGGRKERRPAGLPSGGCPSTRTSPLAARESAGSTPSSDSAVWP